MGAFRGFSEGLRFFNGCFLGFFKFFQPTKNHTRTNNNITHNPQQMPQTILHINHTKDHKQYYIQPHKMPQTILHTTTQDATNNTTYKPHKMPQTILPTNHTKSHNKASAPGALASGCSKGEVSRVAEAG